MVQGKPRPFRVLTFVTLFAALVGCNLLKKGGDDAGATGAEAAVAEPAAEAGPATTPTAEPAAANENDIARFPDETKLDNVAATIKRFAYIREAPLSGKVVQSVNNGQAVTEIASRDKYFLVTFDAGGTKKMGWVINDAFTPVTVDAGIRTPVCAAPEIPVFSDQAYCARQCTADTDCPAGTACKGTAQKIVNGQLGIAISVCVAFQRPTTVVDSGAPVTPPPVVDSGVKPVSITDVSDPPCAAGAVLLKKDKKCHKLCPTVASCAGACVTCEGQRVCTPIMQRNFCK
jgi:hypothetical protein